MSIGKKLAGICIALAMAAALCFGAGITALAKADAGFEKNPQWVDEDFVVLNEQGGEDASVLGGGELSFTGIADDYGTILYSKTKQTAPCLPSAASSFSTSSTLFWGRREAR